MFGRCRGSRAGGGPGSLTAGAPLTADGPERALGSRRRCLSGPDAGPLAGLIVVVPVVVVAPALTGMALIHGYTTGFWVAPAIFGAGAVTCGTLSRFGPLRASGAAAAAPAGAAAQQAAAAHAA